MLEAVAAGNVDEAPTAAVLAAAPLGCELKARVAAFVSPSENAEEAPWPAVFPIEVDELRGGAHRKPPATAGFQECLQRGFDSRRLHRLG